MDAVRFVIERRRMFAVTGENPKHSMFNMGTPAEEVVREVEEWATAHPRRLSSFCGTWGPKWTTGYRYQYAGQGTNRTMWAISPASIVA